MARRSSKPSGERAPRGLFDEVEAKSQPAPASEAAAPLRAPPRAEPPPAPPREPLEPCIWTVTRLTQEIEARLQGMGRCSVEGEVSGIRNPASGHVYFDLKDGAARISCAIWRSQVKRALSGRLEEGAEVVVHGKLDVYAPRGSYSLIVERVEQRGIGALLAKLEELKLELRHRGWFDRRRPLPSLPRTIGLVTSRDGAALRDFLRTRSLRWPLYPVRLCHSAVQGPGSAVEIAAAIDALDASGVDVIVVTRGGGSLEDLWAFNELPVAEAIWRASVPVVSAVGHESDTGLSDLVADVRAHTPTDAAQTVIPDRATLLERLQRADAWLTEAMDAQLAGRMERLDRLARSRTLRSADWILHDRARELAHLGRTLRNSVRQRLDNAVQRLTLHHAALARRSPAARIQRWDQRLARAGGELIAAGRAALERGEGHVALAATRLEGISPLKVLARGYSTTRRAGDPGLLTDAGAVQVGDELETRLHRGTVRSKVIGTAPPPAPDGGEDETP